jgi:hypothetical protein
MADPFELLDLNPKGMATACRTGVAAARVISRAATGFDYPTLDTRSLEGAGDETGGDEEEPTYSAADLDAAVDAACKQAESETEARVRATMLQSFEHRQAEALTALAAGPSAARHTFDAWLEARSGASGTLALTAARALAREALARQPLAEVGAFLRATVVRLDGCPSLELHLPPDLVEAGRALAAEIAVAAGYRGAVEVRADPALQPGAARLDWAGGMAIRDPGALEREVDALVRAWLPADPPAAEAATERPPPPAAGEESPPAEEPGATSEPPASPAPPPPAPSPEPDERQAHE